MGSHLFLLGFIFGLFHVLVAGPDSTKYAARYRSTLNCIFKNNLGGKSWLEESDIRVLKKCLKDSERTPPLKFTDLFSNKYNDRNSRKNVDEISLPMFTTVINANPPEIKYIWVPDDLDTIKDTMKDLRKPLLSMLLAKRNQIKSNRDQYMSKCFSEYTNFEDMDESELRKCFQQITANRKIPKCHQPQTLNQGLDGNNGPIAKKYFVKQISFLDGPTLRTTDLTPNIKFKSTRLTPNTALRSTYLTSDTGLRFTDLTSDTALSSTDLTRKKSLAKKRQLLIITYLASTAGNYLVGKLASIIYNKMFPLKIDPAENNTAVDQNEKQASNPTENNTTVDQNEKQESNPAENNTTVDQNEKQESNPAENNTTVDQNEKQESNPEENNTTVEQNEKQESNN